LKLSGDAAGIANREQEAQLFRTLLTDDDGDGLVAGDEQYWQTDPQDTDTDDDGFLDGEEILSGHDPRVPGPKDYLDRRQNLTQQTTDLLVGGLLSGELMPDHPNYQETLNTFVQSLTEQESSLDRTSLVELKISDNSDTAKQAYIKAMLTEYPDFLGSTVHDIRLLLDMVKDIKISDPSQLTDDAPRYVAYQQEALRISDEIGGRIAAGIAIPVPPAFKRQHTNIILVQRLLQTDLRLSATMHEDPIRGMVAVQRIIRLATQTIPVVIRDYALAMNQKLQ
jgi:hypothetical protein